MDMSARRVLHQLDASTGSPCLEALFYSVRGLVPVTQGNTVLATRDVLVHARDKQITRGVGSNSSGPD
jgi:hypothetical protein